MNVRSIVVAALVLSFSLPAFAQGPGGGGFNPGGGGDPGGGGGSGSFTYDSIASDVTNADHTVYRVDGGLLYRYAAAPTAVSVPAAVTALADGLFAGCTSLVTADLSATAIEEIPSDCFAGCTALTSVILPDTCTAIGPNAFAGCTALSSVTAPGVATVGADAFRGCTALTSVPAFAEGATIGEWSFAASGLADLDLVSIVPSTGAFSGCTSLASAVNPLEDLPAALFSGCTALDFDPSACYGFGQAALAGVPYETIPLEWAEIGPYAFAADAATVETLVDSPYPEYLEYDATSFLGRTVSYDTGDGIALLEAANLVEWLRLQTITPMSSVVQPASYATADLENWLDSPSNVESILSYAGDPDLTVVGDAFLFTPPSAAATSVRVTVESTSDLLDADAWTPDALTLASTAEDGVQTYTTTNTTAFARLAFSPAWQTSGK